MALRTSKRKPQGNRETPQGRDPPSDGTEEKSETFGIHICANRQSGGHVPERGTAADRDPGRASSVERQPQYDLCGCGIGSRLQAQKGKGSGNSNLGRKRIS